MQKIRRKYKVTAYVPENVAEKLKDECKKTRLTESMQIAFILEDVLVPQVKRVEV